MALGALFFAACSSKPLPPEKMSYAGTWTGTGFQLVITPDGGVAYKRVSGNGSVSITGPLSGFKGDSFEVGILFFKTTFEVSQPPTQERGKWTMVVDGVTLTRTPEPGSPETVSLTAEVARPETAPTLSSGSAPNAAAVAVDKIASLPLASGDAPPAKTKENEARASATPTADVLQALGQAAEAVHVPESFPSSASPGSTTERKPSAAALPENAVKPVLTGSPAVICRSALSRYPSVAPDHMKACKAVNGFAAQAIDVFSATYVGYLSDATFQVLLRINNQEQLDCAVLVANKFSQSMNSKYLESTCL